MNFINTPILEDTGSPLPPSLISNTTLMNHRGSSYLPGNSSHRSSSTVYNPWEVERFRDSQIREANGVLQTQCQLHRDLYGSAMRDQGIEVSEEFLDRVVGRYTPLYTTAKEAQDLEADYRNRLVLHQAIMAQDESRVQPANMTQHILDVEEKNLKKYEGLTKAEKYKLLEETQIQQMEEEEKASKKDLRNRYDTKAYSSYFSRHNNYNNYNYAPSNMDDITVELPGNITRQYDVRRRQFAEALMAQFIK